MLATKIKDYFPSLSHPELLKEIVEVSELREVPKGEVLMDVGRYIQFMPLLLKGVIKIYREDEDGNEILLYYLESGKTCAISMTCCMQKEKSSIRAIVEEDTEFISIPVQYVDEWMMKHRAWKDFILMTYTNRFDQLLTALDVIAFKKMDQRVLHYINEKLKSSDKKHITNTHQEIALELNTSREVVSRMLKKLELAEEITMKRGEISIVK